MTLTKHRRPNLAHFYGRTLPSITPGDFDFRFELLRPAVVPMTIDRIVKSCTWTEGNDGPMLTGVMAVQRPDPGDASSAPIGNGHRVRCSVLWRGEWYVLWTMRVYGMPDVDLPSGELQVTLKDDLDLIRRGRRRWRFRKTRHRKFGWLPQEVAREVARTLGLQLGAVAVGKHRTSFSLTGTGLDAIQKAYAHESEKTGVHYFLRARDGRLEILPLRRNTTLYVIRRQITAALLRGQQAIRPVTVIHAHGRVGKGKAARKVKYTAFRQEILQRFGRSEEEWNAGRVDSHAELVERTKRRLANKIRVRRTGDLTVPMIPFIRRGDGLQWVTSEAGWHGGTEFIRDRSFIFCTFVSHTVSGDLQTTQLTVQQEDPYVADQERRDREARLRARARRQKAAA